jgi:hypothetical protein
MCFGKQERSVLEDCLQNLASLMVTFRTYGGAHIDVNRGDFDIDFFRGLNDTCSDIHDGLLSLLEASSQNVTEGAEGSEGEEIVVAKAVEIPAFEQ